MDSSSSSSSSSSSFLKTREMNLQTSPPKPHNCAFTPFRSVIFFFFILCINLVPTACEQAPIFTSDFESVYDRHCNLVVPRSPSDSDRFVLSGSVGFPSVLKTGYFRGGSPLLAQTLVGGTTEAARFFFFNVYNGQRTGTNGVYEFRGRLTLSVTLDAIAGNSTARRNLRLVRFRGPVVSMRRGRLSFFLKGFWSENSRTLCMVGSGTSPSNGNSLAVALKLHYPRNWTVYTSLVSGSLESLDKGDSPNYFVPISLLALPRDSNYEYTLVGKDSDNACSNGDDRGTSVSSLPENGCSVLNRVERFELEYGKDCNGVDCNPLGSGLGFVPKYMFYYRTHCSKEKKWQMLLGFPNSSYSFSRFPFDPSTTFVAEGAWNEKGNRLCAVACRILNITGSFDNAYVGNCSTGFSLIFPPSLSLRNWSNVVGEIWSTRALDSSGQFHKIGFKSFNEKLMDILRVKYEYTANETLTKTCLNKNVASSRGKTYPDEYSWDMTFDISVRNNKGQVASGFSTPFYVGDQPYGNRFFGFRNFSPRVQVMPNNSPKTLVNITHKMSLTLPIDFKFSRDGPSSREVKISAEGTYDKGTGALCMVGCRHLGSDTENLIKNDTLDCEIMISVQFSPLGTKTGKNIKGSIESTREKSDPLNFGRLELSSNSIYTGQAAESIWRMDLELTMVLISKTLTCVFVGLQLFHVKSHPDVLPFSSIAMLLVLTVGHMIPLLLNFEALFVSHRIPQNDFLGSGGWLEANEVIVRIVTMVAFLLQLRLLQLTWSSRKDDPSGKNLWSFERKVLYVTLPLYIFGALVAWFVNHLKNSSSFPHRAFRNPHRMGYVVAPFKRRSFQKHSLWNDLKSYAGLVMDGFLLPQILFNVLLDSREKALAHLFYGGTTLVRLLPHAYDLYRAHAYSTYLDLSYIYASHRLDFYSTAWDIVIPCGGLLFAVLIFLQQRSGGRCILPRRFKNSSAYEKVPVISNDDL